MRLITIAVISVIVTANPPNQWRQTNDIRNFQLTQYNDIDYVTVYGLTYTP